MVNWHAETFPWEYDLQKLIRFICSISISVYVELAACMKMAHSYIPQTYSKMHGSIAQDLKAGIALTWRILNAWQGQVEQLRIWHGYVATCDPV